MKHSDPSSAVAQAATELLADYPLPGAAAPAPSVEPVRVELADPDRLGAPLSRGALVLGVGIGAHAFPELLAAARSGGVAALVLRRPVDNPGGPDQVRGRARSSLKDLDGPDERSRQAARAGVRLHWIDPDVSWNELHAELLRRLAPPPLRADDELAELAQTIATLTGGLVTIEDTSARVLAYSRSSDEVDELRRLSILGRSGPPAYLALLRTWGIYDRLAAGEEVVEIAEHPESGVRRRLAVGVFAGDRQLATIWLQQGSTEFGPHAGQALLGAARLTAAHLAGRIDGAGRSAQFDLAGLLSGTGTATALGRAAHAPCAVVAFGLSERDADPGAVLDLDELATIVTVHASAFRRSVAGAKLDGRVYLLLTRLDSVSSATAMLAGAVAAARRHVDGGTRAAVGKLVPEVLAAAQSRRTADLALDLPGTAPVIDFDDARPRLITGLIEKTLAQQAYLLDERVQSLISADLPAARTLLRYLDTGSDSARVAADLGVHPTTVRYRLRKAESALSGDLADPDVRLAAQLQLRCGLRRGASEG